VADRWTREILLELRRAAASVLAALTNKHDTRVWLVPETTEPGEPVKAEAAASASDEP
jgi:hypothetical protein